MVTPDPEKFVTKHFCSNMENMSCYISMQLRKYKDQYNLTHLNTDREFNSCSLLIYDTGSKMGWHTDTKYTLAGSYRDVNYQVQDTPVVILTFGNERELF